MDNFETSVLARYAGFRENRNYSEDILQKLTDELLSFEESTPDRVVTVAVCGSFGRLEASKLSDLDFILISRGDGDGGKLRNAIKDIMRDLGLPDPDPNPKGVFATDAEADDMLNEIGSKKESYDDRSRRLLMLLESRCVFRQAGYDELVSKLVDEYARDVLINPEKNFVYLLNDLIRYFRTICVNYQYAKDDEWGKWPIRNIKLRHSRVLMYFSLLACLGELSKPQSKDKVTKLRKYIKLTPIERVFQIYKDNNDAMFYRFAGAYDVFLRHISDPSIRKKLMDLEYNDRYKEGAFADLKANSDALAAEIVRFIFARRGSWSDRFYEYLLI